MDDLNPSGATPGFSRRRLLMSSAAAGGAALAGGLVPSGAAAAPRRRRVSGDRIVMLGVNGGPILSTEHSQPALMLVADGAQYLVDCGAGVERQTVLAGLGFAPLQNLFLTHHHLDHVAGFPALATLGWDYTPSQLARLDVWGPPPVHRFVSESLHAFEFSIDLFRTTVSGAPPTKTVKPRTVVLPKHGIARVMEDEHVRVTATRVNHGADVHDAYAYRFDVKRSGRSVVFSGDTAPSRQLERLARDADVLVHEVSSFPDLEPIIRSVAPSEQDALRHALHSIHTSVEDLPGIAKRANAKRLVMCHYVPAFVPARRYLMAAKKAAARVGYRGEIVAPTDLDEIAL